MHDKKEAYRHNGVAEDVTWRSTDRTETIAAPCEPAPGRRWHAAGFDTTLGSTSTLHLFNPFGEDATVSLIFATPDGPVRLVATDNLVVPAGTSRQLDLGRFQPEIADLGVTAEVASGRIVAQGEVDIGPPGKSRGVSGRALLRAAEEAEARGDLGAALRLRFRAGVADLAARDLVPARASTGMAELERRLRSPTFTGLARRFEEVAYGGRAAQGDDVAAAREGWPRVRQEVGERPAAGSAR